MTLGLIVVSLALLWVAITKTDIAATMKERFRQRRIDRDLQKKVSEHLASRPRSWGDHAADELQRDKVPDSSPSEGES